MCLSLFTFDIKKNEIVRRLFNKVNLLENKQPSSPIAVEITHSMKRKYIKRKVFIWKRLVNASISLDSYHEWSEKQSAWISL